MSGLRWPVVALGEVAPLVRRPVDVLADGLYGEIGIRSHGRGVFHKPPMRGYELGEKHVFRIEPGDLLFNIIFAWEGAVAVAAPDDIGKIGSHRFLTCVCDTMRADAKFLYLFFRTQEGLRQLGIASPGGAGRNRTLSLAALAQLRVPLPPLAEQKRIVARLEGTMECISKRAAAVKQVEAALGAMLQVVLRKTAGDRHVRIGDLMVLRPTDTAVTPDEVYQFAGVYSFGRGVFRSVAKKGSETAYQRLTRLRQGNFVYPKLMAWEGALGVAPASCDGCFVSPEFPVFEVDTDAIEPELLELHFRDPANWPKSTGTNVRRRRVHPDKFLHLEMPLPPLDQQKSLAEACRKAARALAAQREAAEELDKLFPSLLHEVFSEETIALPRAAA